MEKISAMTRALEGLPTDVQNALIKFALYNDIPPTDRDWIMVGIAGLAARTPHDLKLAGNEILDAFDARVVATQKTADALREAALADMKNNLSDAIKSTLQESGEGLSRGALLKSGALAALIISGALLAAVGGGYWLGWSTGQTLVEAERQKGQELLDGQVKNDQAVIKVDQALIDAADQKGEAKVAEAMAQLPRTATWASSIRSEEQQKIAAWAVVAMRTEADRQAAEWGLSPEGHLAHRFSEANGAFGGIRGVAQSCVKGTRSDDPKTKEPVCTLAYWLVP